MSGVSCWADECEYCENGWCQRGIITINEDLECEDYKGYRDSYTDAFYKAYYDDGKKFRRLCKNGKKIEYNGYVFYTEDRITTDDFYSVTEERTGYLASFRLIKDKWEKFVEICATLPDVSTYPIEEKERK